MNKNIPLSKQPDPWANVGEHVFFPWVIAVSLLTGIAYFRRMERTFADVI